MDNRNALEAGTMLRHYRIDSVIGQGGFGITYAAFDTELQRKVAIKECYPKDFVSRDGTTVVPTSSKEEVDFNWALGKFIDEATTLAMFKNNGIVQVLQILKDENKTAYMVLEFVEGKPLNDWLKALKSKPTEQQLKTVIAPLMDALEVVHENGIAHRDIAPDNIFIRGDGDAVLLDFGAARQTIIQQSRTMNLVVKDGYSAPEQYYAEGKQGPWTDIYAFAATLYRAIAGKRPIDAMARLDAFNNGDPDPLEPLEDLAKGSYSEAFLSAVMKGMTPQTKQRPQSLAEWRTLLFADGLADGDKTMVVAPGLYSPSLAAESGESKRGYGKIAGVVALIAIAIIGGGYWYNEQQILKAEIQAQKELEAQLAAQEKARQQELARLENAEREKRIAAERAAQKREEERLAREAKQKALKAEQRAKEAEQRAKEVAEARAYAKAAQQAWENAKGQDTRAIYTNFLSEYGASEHAQNAKQALNELSSPWTHLLDDNGAAQRGRAVAANKDFIAVAAEAQHQNNSGAQAVIYKYSWGGRLLWKEEFGDEGDEFFEDIVVLDDGSIVVVGHLIRPSSNAKNAIIRSYNSAGELNWEKAFSRDQGLQFNAVAQSVNGEIVAVGDQTDLEGRKLSGWLVKFNRFGDFLLEKTITAGGQDSFSDVRSFANGNFAVIGSTTPVGQEKSKFWLLKLDTAFNVVMDHTPSFGEMSSLDVADDGKYFAVGNIKLSDTAQMSMASQVTRDNKVQPIINTNKMGARSNSIALSETNEIFIAGQTLQSNGDQFDGLITKYSANFKEVLWERVLGGSGRDVITDLAVLADGTAVVVGSSEVQKDSGSDFWIMRLGPTGQYKLN